MYEAAARVYMLPIVGCNILADKSHVLIEARYISIFVDFARHDWP